MRTKWSMAYIWQKCNGGIAVNKWQLETEAALKAATNVSWSCGTAGDLYVFRPAIDKDTPNTANKAELDQLCSHLTGFPTDFVALQAVTGWNWPDVLRVGRAAVGLKLARVHVDRRGRYTFLTRR